MPYFFLSYASADDDGYVERFYRDLCDAVRARTGHPADDIGFRDRSGIGMGADWREALGEALASSPVLVAVCSPSYFASETCGKEWQLFTELSRRRRRDERPPIAEPVLPIVWVPTASPPEVAARLHHTHEGFGSTYRREGLHFMARLHRFRDDYHTLVVRMAERIIAVAEAVPPVAAPALAALPDLDDVANAFTAPAARHGSAVVPAAHPRGSLNGTSTAGAESPDPMPAPAPAVAAASSPARVSVGGPRHVHFVLVVGTADELAAVREDTGRYGAAAADWAPYRPAPEQRIAVFAQRVASARDLTSALGTVVQPLAELLDHARTRNEVVVLLVDVWSAALEPYHQVLVDYDAVNAPATAVLVPWDATDAEAGGRAEQLRAGLCRALPNNTARDDPVFRPAIPTLEAFRTALDEVLAVTQARVFRFGAVTRPPGAVDRPILTRPDEAGVP